MDSPDLFAAAMDIERHVASQGWDQPALLFALVPTERVRADQPELAAQLGVTDAGPALTTFEQPAPPDEEELDDFLARIEWPAQIVGAALVVERLVLPPEAEAQIADRPDAATVARLHPDARDMRIVAAVTRDGDRMCVLRLRGQRAGGEVAPDDHASLPETTGAGEGVMFDDDDEVLTGEDLVPGLADALLATFH